MATLDDEELRRRVVAARELRGLSQTQLGELFKKDGLGKHDPGRIERGTMTMQRAHREAFVHHLRVPSSWFTEADVDIIVGLKPRPAINPEQARAVLERALAEIDRVSDQAPSGTKRAQGGSDPGDAAAGGGGG